MNCTYLINMDSGRLECRDEYTEQQVNLKPIPDEVTSMILHGEVTAQDVVNAISIKMKESGDFNLADYLEGMKRLNVRQSQKQTAPERAPLKDVTDAITPSEVKASVERNDQSSKTTKRDRAKKVNDALDAASMTAFNA